MGYLEAKDHSPLYQRPQSFLFPSQLPSPALSFHSTNLKVAEMGSVRIPASWCRSQGPEDLGNWHKQSRVPMVVFVGQVEPA